MQQPLQSSPGALANKVTIVILPGENKATMGGNQDDSYQKLDKLVQPSPAKRKHHNDAIHFVPCLLSMGAHICP